MRKYFRKRIISILKDAQIATVEDNVFSWRSIPDSINELPVIIVYGKNEISSPLDESPKSYEKQFEVTIEIKTMATDDEELNDELDDLSQLVEDLIEADFDLERQALVNHSGTQYQTEPDGQSPVGSVMMTFVITYKKNARNESDLDDLKTIASKWNVNDNSEVSPEDVIEFE